MTPLLWFDVISGLAICAFWLGLEIGWRQGTCAPAQRQDG